MFSVTPRRFSRKWICSVAAAMAAAALTVAALAGSAFAIPNDTIQKIDDGAVQFGGSGSCVAGLPPGANASLDWRENLTDGTVSPKLTGSVCVQNNTNTYRVALRLYYLDSTPGPLVTHVLVSESRSLPATGNGAAVNDFSVNLQGPKVLSAAIHHAHIQLQQQIAGVWTDVGTASTADY